MKKSNERLRKDKMNKLKKIAPKLFNIDKKYPFRIPENYFDDFSVRLQENIKSLEAGKEARETPERGIIQFLKPVIGLAAAVALALILLLIYRPPKFTMPKYFGKMDAATVETITEEEQLLFLIKTIDENSFLTLLQESSAEEIEEAEYDNEELLSYLTANISEYEFFLGDTY